jgi:hypothetical protein
MLQVMSSMVAIASGSRSQVGTWAKSLREAAIICQVVTSRGTSELWVGNNDVDEARSAILSAEPVGLSRMW